MTKEIQLTQGQVALVDDWWYEELNQFKWFAQWVKSTNSFYAERSSSILLGKRKAILMHAVVANTPKGMDTDHIDHNTLNNQEYNLRICTHSQNRMNSRKRVDNTSGYVGVFRAKKKWIARIRSNGKILSFGTYTTPEEAAHAYDKAARRLRGEFAVLNFPSHSSNN